MKWVGILFLALVVLIGGRILQNHLAYQGSPDSAVHRLLSRSAREFQAAGEYQAFGTVVSMPEGHLRELGLHFTRVGPHARDQLRRDLVEVGHRFLEIINADQEVRPAMTVYPFGVDNIDIVFFLQDPNRYPLRHPEIGTAGIRRGRLFFKTFVEEDGIPRIVDETRENYEEALEILKKQSEGKGFE